MRWGFIGVEGGPLKGDCLACKHSSAEGHHLFNRLALRRLQSEFQARPVTSTDPEYRPSAGDLMNGRDGVDVDGWMPSKWVGNASTELDTGRVECGEREIGIDISAV